MKIKLDLKETCPLYVPPRGYSSMKVTESLPFFKSGFGQYVHRVRRGRVHVRHGVVSHSSFTFWCGGNGFIDSGRGKSGTFYENPPENQIFCAICEGKAIGAGLLGSRKILGRTVMFKPRV